MWRPEQSRESSIALCERVLLRWKFETKRKHIFISFPSNASIMKFFALFHVPRLERKRIFEWHMMIQQLTCYAIKEQDCLSRLMNPFINFRARCVLRLRWKISFSASALRHEQRWERFDVSLWWCLWMSRCAFGGLKPVGIEITILSLQGGECQYEGKSTAEVEKWNCFSPFFPFSFKRQARSKSFICFSACLVCPNLLF